MDLTGSPPSGKDLRDMIENAIGDETRVEG